MNNVIIDTVIEDEEWLRSIPEVLQIIDSVKNAAFSFLLDHEDIDVLSADKPLRINLCLSNDENIQTLNRDFRGLDKPTNVLTFANMDGQDFDAENIPFAEIDLGSIIMAHETMVRESVTEKITLQAHFCHLLVHGILHILGYDHMEESEAEYMEGLEIAILGKMNIANPYKED